MKRIQSSIVALLLVVSAARVGAEVIDLGRHAPAQTPTELEISEYQFLRDGGVVTVKAFGNRQRAVATVTIEWPGDMTGRLTYSAPDARLSAIWHVDTGVLETEDGVTGERVVFRPSDQAEGEAPRWLIEGAAGKVEEVRKENRKAIELMLHAYDEAVDRLNLRRQALAVQTGGEPVPGAGDGQEAIGCFACLSPCDIAQTTGTTRSRCCASALAISGLSCSGFVCASSLCISDCLIGNSLCLCTTFAFTETPQLPQECGEDWPPACV